MYLTFSLAFMGKRAAAGTAKKTTKAEDAASPPAAVVVRRRVVRKSAGDDGSVREKALQHLDSFMLQAEASMNLT